MIELERFSVRQGPFELQVPRLRLQKGEWVAVCGNNGSGKSTFLAALAGLKKFAGLYSLEGRPFRSWDNRSRARLISYLPQESRLSLPFEVYYLVLTGRFPWARGRYQAQDYQLVAKVLEDFDLLGLEGRPFQQLSGGEKQRVLLARTWVRQSPVVLLDEPFNAVDLRHQRHFLRLFRREKEQRLLVAVLHDLALALEHFDRFLFFRQGKLLHDVSRERLQEEILQEVFECRLKLLRCEGHYLIRFLS